MMRQQWLVFVPVTLATAGLAACASVLGGEQVKVRPVDTMQTLTAAPRDALYESAVSAINERDYGRALEYLQAAKAKDPRNVKALNALGVVYDKLGRFDLSARYYAQARAVEPGSRIVAENMGYSGILQRLFNHDQSIAVASIDLPADLNPASPAAATPAPSSDAGKPVIAAESVPAMPVTFLTEKKLIDAPPPTMTAAPLVLPDARPLFASISVPEPVNPVTEKKLIDTPPPTVTAVPLALPDAKHVFASVVLAEPVMPVIEKKLIDTPPPTMTAMSPALPDAKHVFASLSLPEPVVPVIEKRLVDAPPPAMTAMPLTLPDAKHMFASVVLPEPVMPVIEKKLIDAPPPTMTAMPLALPDAKHVFASVVLPEPVMPVIEKKVIDTRPPTVTAAPFVLADARPLLTASLSSAVLSPVAAAPVAPATNSRVRPEVERVAMVQSAPSAVTAPAQAKPVAASISVSSAPVPVEARASAAPIPAVPAISALPAKPVVVASASAPQKKIAPPHVPAVAVAVAPAKPAIPVRTVKRMAANPATVASAPANSRAAVPVSSSKQVARMNSAPAKGKVLFIGQPIKLVNASGKPGGAGTVLRRLTALGWTMRPADSRIQTATVLFYPVKNLAAAKAMQRTLPFPVRLVAESNKAAGMRLVIGRDYLSWKPKNSRIATLWQKRTVMASTQKLSLRGDR